MKRTFNASEAGFGGHLLIVVDGRPDKLRVGSGRFDGDVGQQPDDTGQAQSQTPAKTCAVTSRKVVQ